MSEKTVMDLTPTLRGGDDEGRVTVGASDLIHGLAVEIRTASWEDGDDPEQQDWTIREATANLTPEAARRLVAIMNMHLELLS